MAYVKILNIKSIQGIKRATNYAENEEKTTVTNEEGAIEVGAIQNVIDYAASDIKTEERLVTGINCSVETAGEEMKATAEYWKAKRPRSGQTRDAFHIMQSFSPEDDLTPERAHEIGIEFAKSLQHMDDKVEDPNRHYKMLVCTHVDKAHLHNHIVLCSYDVMNGRMFHECRSVYQMMRDKSDELCRENGLSVIEHPDNERKYSRGEWEAAKEGRSWKDDIRKDIKAYSQISDNWEQYKGYMKKEGYAFREGKHVTYTDKDGHKARDNSLGEEYTKENLESYWREKGEATLESALARTRAERFFADSEKLQKEALKKLEQRNDYISNPQTPLEMILTLVLELIGIDDGPAYKAQKALKTNGGKSYSRYRIERAIETAKRLDIPSEDVLSKELKKMGTAIGSKKKEISKITNTLEKAKELKEALAVYKELEPLPSDAPKEDVLRYREAKAKMYRSGCVNEKQILEFEGRCDGWNARIEELRGELKKDMERYGELKTLKRDIDLAKTEGFIEGTYFEKEKGSIDGAREEKEEAKGKEEEEER